MTCDTNIVIAYLNGETAVIDRIIQWRKEGRALILPTVAESEVLSFSGWTPTELYHAELFLKENFASLSFDRPLAHIAAMIRRKTKMKFPDAAIAATALFTHTPVVTRNIRDFKNIAELEIITI